MARAVEAALRAVEGVHWAEVNPILAHVAVAYEDGVVDPGELAEIVEDVEAAHGVAEGDLPPDLVSHPADDAAIHRGLLALAADATGMGVSVLAGLFRLPRLPVEVTNAIPALDSIPPVRRLLDARPDVETATVLVNALLYGIGQGPLGLLVDATHRVNLLTEMAARRRAWLAAEPELLPGPASEPIVAVEVEPRPVALPGGPVERYGQAASLAALAGGGLTLLATGDPRRTADMLLAGLPRAARLGREGFAGQLGRTLAGRRILPMDPTVLRRLDRIDTVLVDAAAVMTGRQELGATAAVGGVDPRAVDEAVRRLFDPGGPRRQVAGGGLVLGPAEACGGSWPRGARALGGRMVASGESLLALERDGVVIGLASVRPAVLASTAELVEAARAAELSVVVAGARSGVGEVLGADRSLPGGDHTARSVRLLQREGRVVALVSRRHGSALRAADCGIGIVHPAERHPPWGADLICFHLAHAATILDAVRLARRANRTSIAISAAGSLAAGALSLGPLPRASRRSVAAAQVASLAAIGTGAWSATALRAREATVEREVVPWHALAVDEVLAELRSGPGGLTGTAAAERTTGTPPAPKGAGVAGLLASELTSPLSLILGGGATLAAVTGSALDAAMLGGVLGLDALISVAQRMGAERAIGRLASAASNGRTTVLRDGREDQVAAAALVPGDVVRLAAGDVVPADCRVLDAVGLETDESSLTGESFPVQKSEAPVEEAAPVVSRRSMVYEGTAVAAGHASAVVVASGAETEARRGSDSATPPPTGVETRLEALTAKTVPVVIGAGTALALNGLLRGQPVEQALTAGVSLSAAAVPEGLAFVATAAQTAAARRLGRQGVLVRNARVLEALGRVDVLCFDKTGTLTEGRLQLRRVSNGQSDEVVGALSSALRPVVAAALRATPRPRSGGLPHPTDQAVVEGAAAAGVQRSEGLGHWQKAGSLPFNPERGYHAVLARTGAGSLVSVKGAAEVVLPRCAVWRRGDDGAIALDDGARAAAEAEVERLARRGLRVLAVAERPLPGSPRLSARLVEGLELRGFLGVADAARDSASAPLARLSGAGIDVVMVTGDHPSTAEAVAGELGLMNGRRVLTGSDLDAMSDEALAEQVGDVAIFARVTPSHKVRIVSAFRRSGRVVAMTGDGANDAQAIRLADIGIAFGPRATEAAKGAADLVVTEDDVGLLIDTIVEGRAMWASVRDALAILLGGNVGEVAFTTGAALVAGRPPLTARQLLLVNLFTDLAPALVIALQPPRTTRIDLAREGPETSLAGPLSRDVAIRAVATAAGAYGAWGAGRMTGSPARARTIALTSLVGAQLGQTLVVGRRSPLVVGTALASAAALAAVVQTPGVSQFFDCRPLGPVGWTISVTSASLATAGAAAAHVLAR